jgi:hypothetical protein
VPDILKFVGSKEYYVLSMSHVANRQIKSLFVVVKPGYCWENGVSKPGFKGVIIPFGFG